jgi:glycine/D-amino acid oxidase-like deaminating enzyme
MRAIIVGGGIMGLCTAWALCRSGHAVVLYEQGPIPNPLASSYDEHRLTRFTSTAR